MLLNFFFYSNGDYSIIFSGVCLLHLFLASILAFFSSSGSSSSLLWWRKVWISKLTSKLKLFLWKLFHSILLSNIMSTYTREKWWIRIFVIVVENSFNMIFTFFSSVFMLCIRGRVAYLCILDKILVPLHTYDLLV